MLIGVHVPGDDPLVEAETAKADAIQMFLGDPQSFRKPEPRPDRAALVRSKLPIYVHAPYRLNVCHPQPRVRVPSRKTLAENADAAAEIGAAAVIVHGGYAEDDPNEGPIRWWKVFEEREFPVRILIENTAGGTNAVARYVEQIERLWERVGEYGVGFCFDTCHAHAAGEDLEDVAERILGIVGKIDVVHVNDSRDPPGTGADRHTNIGRGSIDPELILAMVKAAGAEVVIFETPWPGIVDDVAWLRSRA